MNIEKLREFCLSLQGVKEDIKWGHDLCFLIGDKMFCVTGVSGPFSVSLKVEDSRFEEMCEREGVEPAPYLARYKWVLIKENSAISDKEFLQLVKRSYELIMSKLNGKKLKELGIK